MYDESERRPTPGVVGYDERFVPGDPAYRPDTAWRGNPTTIRRYSNAAQHSLPVTETRTYDACGNVLTCDVGVGRTKYEYDAGNQYMAPSLIELTGSGPGFHTSLTVTSSRYTPNGQLLWQHDNEDQRTDFQYDPAGRPTLLTASSGATVTFAYDDVDMRRTLTVMDGEKPPNLAAYEVRAFDGKGRLSRVSRPTADGWDIEEYQYDRRGRMHASTAPYREGTAPSWSTVDYDGLSRPVRLRDPDGGLTEWHYDELAHPQNASPATVPGSCVRVTDPRGRERWQRSGPLGSVEEVVEPAPPRRQRGGLPGRRVAHDLRVRRERQRLRDRPVRARISHTAEEIPARLVGPARPCVSPRSRRRHHGGPRRPHREMEP